MKFPWLVSTWFFLVCFFKFDGKSSRHFLYISLAFKSSDHFFPVALLTVISAMIDSIRLKPQVLSMEIKCLRVTYKIRAMKSYS